jgi:hypothetical protein
LERAGLQAFPELPAAATADPCDAEGGDRPHAGRRQPIRGPRVGGSRDRAPSHDRRGSGGELLHARTPAGGDRPGDGSRSALGLLRQHMAGRPFPGIAGHGVPLRHATRAPGGRSTRRRGRRSTSTTPHRRARCGCGRGGRRGGVRGGRAAHRGGVPPRPWLGTRWVRGEGDARIRDPRCPGCVDGIGARMVADRDVRAGGVERPDPPR